MQALKIFQAHPCQIATERETCMCEEESGTGIIQAGFLEEEESSGYLKGESHREEAIGNHGVGKAQPWI